MKIVTKMIMIMAMGAMVFSGSQRTSNLGGTQYWSDDWDYVSIFPQAIGDHANLGWYDGTNFTAYCGEGDKVWGLSLSGDNANNLIDMNLGLSNGLGLAFSLDMDDDDATDDDWYLAAGKNLAFGNAAFHYDSNGDMGIALARAQSVIWWDNMFASLLMIADDDDTADDDESAMLLGADFYKNANGSLFGLGFNYNDYGDGALWTTWTYAHEAQLFDWMTLRFGYSKGYDLMNSMGTEGGFTAGAGMTWGGWGLDVTVNDLSAVAGNPLHYATGRNDDAVFAGLDLSYRW